MWLGCLHYTIVRCIATMRPRSNLARILATYSRSCLVNAPSRSNTTLCSASSDGLSSNDKLEWSYIHCPGTTPLLGVTLGQLARDKAAQWGNTEAVVDVDQNVRLTYEQVNKEVDRLASGLISLGLQRGDRIGIWCPNTYQWYLTFLASAKAGLITVTLNPAYQSPEIKYCVQKVGMKAIVLFDKLKTQDYYELLANVAPELRNLQKGSELKCATLPSLTNVITTSEEAKPGTITFSELQNAGDSNSQKRMEELYSVVQSDHPCNIQFTSGTTGQPKAATLSHHNVVNNGQLVYKRLGYALCKERICVSVPFFHCYGNVAGIISSVHCGATVVLPNMGFDAAASLRAVSKEKCSVLYGTPTMHVDYLNAHSPGNEYSNLRMITSGGAICPVEISRKLIRTFGVEDIASLYGMTETSPVSIQRREGDPLERRLHTVGYPLQHTELKIVDKDGAVVPIGSAGELCVRGYLTMLGYWDEEEKTKEIMKEDRWLHTGDVFVMEKDGLCQIVGRLKDMLIRGGENIYPKEIEEFLHTHPDIAEAYVFGVPDPRMGEEVCTWIRLKDGAKEPSLEEIKQFCKGNIAHFKIPKYVHYTADFPKTVSGKVQKFKMQEESIKIFDLKPM